MGDDNFVVEYIDVAPIAEEVSSDRLYYILFVPFPLRLGPLRA